MPPFKTAQERSIEMRYIAFVFLAVLIHALVFIGLWLPFERKQAAPGGGEGGVITISLATINVPGPVASKSLGRDAVAATQTIPRTTRHTNYNTGADRASGKHAGSGQGPSVGPNQGTGSGIEGADAVLAEIRRRIEGAKRFPMLARRLRMEGTSGLVFKLKEDGTLQSLRITQTSGTTILDEEALATIRRAAPFPYYPEPIQIGIHFALD